MEVIGKVIDGRSLNHSFWFFYGALSNVEYSLTVTDTTNGAARRYFNLPGELASVGDTSAFGPQGAFAVPGPAAEPADAGAAPSTAATPAAGTACRATAARLCLDGGRFSITVHWQDFTGRTGVGTAVPLTADTDTVTGRVRTYPNPLGQFASVADTMAF